MIKLGTVVGQYTILILSNGKIWLCNEQGEGMEMGEFLMNVKDIVNGEKE